MKWGSKCKFPWARLKKKIVVNEGVMYYGNFADLRTLPGSKRQISVQKLLFVEKRQRQNPNNKAHYG